MSNATSAEEDQKGRDDLARAVKGGKKPTGTRIEKIRWVFENHQAARVDGVFLDATTASMLVKIHDALNEKNRVMFVALPMCKMVAVGWKLVK